MKDIQTKADYAEYQQRVADFFEREGIANLSTISDGESNGEPFFSWNPCHCCQRSLGGNRYDCNGWNPELQQVQEYTVCEDCVYFAEYGQLDDTTMMTIANS